MPLRYASDRASRLFPAIRRSAGKISGPEVSRLRFFAEFCKNPREIGSITPSSGFLTRRMMDEVEWSQVRSVVELGAGTGVVTEAIHRRMSPSSQGIVFECNREMRQRLERRYPHMSFHASAEHLVQSLSWLGIGGVDCIVSGLPWTNFSAQTRTLLLEQIVQSLNPGGAFIMFQYSLQLRAELRRHFHRVDTKLVLLNVPHAFVYSCRAA
jgi:phospholipid N-methyltransferase